MLKRQLEDLKHKFSRRSTPSNYNPLQIPKGAVRVRVRTGKNAGKDGDVATIGQDRIGVTFADGSTEDGVYGKYLILDENGEPDEAVRDTLGAPVVEGAWVSYSQPTNTSHTLEIGRVKRITDIGTLIVAPKMRDGRILSKDSPRYDLQDVADRKVQPYRAIKIPTDERRLMLAIFTDFESALDGRFDETDT